MAPRPRVLSDSFNNLHSAFSYLGYRALTFPLENLLLVHFEKQVNTTVIQSLGTDPTILTWEPQSIINGRTLVMNKELKVVAGPSCSKAD